MGPYHLNLIWRTSPDALLLRGYIDRRQHAGRQEPIPTIIFVSNMESKDRIMSNRNHVQKMAGTFA